MRRQDFLAPEVADEIKAHARACYPQEMAGVLTPEGYVRLENIHPDPENHVQWDAEVMDGLLLDGKLLAIVHSHPNGPNAPSKTDMELQVRLNVPAVLACVKGDQVLPLTVWGDMFEPDPLKRRPFQHGVTDCYELCRDWYWFEEGRRPPPVPRSWRWWTKGELMVDELFAPSGFEKISVDDIERGCIALVSVGKTQGPNHGLLYLGDGLVLNHATSGPPFDPTRLSGEEPLARWMPYITRWLKPHEKRSSVWQSR